MASINQCLASMARLTIRPAPRPQFTSISRLSAPLADQQFRLASQAPKKREKKKKQHKTFRVWRKDSLVTFSLCDAMRYIRAFSVGQPAQSVKYDLAVKLTTPKRSAIIRGHIRLPHAVRSDVRIAVICKEGGLIENDARLGGAVAVGEESLFQQIRQGNIDFNRLICHTDSLPALDKANLGRILGPKGLMPSVKTKTVTKDIKSLLRELSGAENYRERDGVIRLPVGQLAFSPDMLSDNIKAVMASIKQDIAALEGQVSKGIDEVVLSSTWTPGFSLSGGFNSTDEKVTAAHLSTLV